MYNVLQTHKDGRSQTMLGCNATREEAARYVKYYNDKLPGCNEGRARNGYPPLEVTYSVIEVEGEFQDWFPEELRA